MEMHQVRYFLAVAAHLNFTRAARELRVAQPSLTRAIQKLEGELNGPLFCRERSNTHLTELGRLMLPHLRAAYAAAAAAADQARRLRRRELGSLALGVGAAVSPEAPAALIRASAGAVPELDLSVEVADGPSIERRLMAGEFDAAIVTPAEARHDRFDLREIASEPLVVAFGPGHRFAGGARVALASLDAEPLVVHAGSDYDAAAADAMAGAGLRRLVRGSSRDAGWVAGLVRAGLGCAVVPAGFAAARRLDARPLDGVALTHRTVLATVAGRRHPAALSRLVRALDGRG